MLGRFRLDKKTRALGICGNGTVVVGSALESRRPDKNGA
jgi:hypothetical protein